MKQIINFILLPAAVLFSAFYLYHHLHSAEGIGAQNPSAAERASRAEVEVKALRHALARTSKVADEKSKQAGEAVQILGSEKEKNSNPLAAMMKNPKMRQLMAEQQKAMLGPIMAMQYTGFSDRLGLTPEESGTLQDLLLKKKLAGMDVRMSMFDDNTDEAKRANAATQFKREREACEARIKQFLGEEDYQSLQKYEKELLGRTTVTQFNAQLGNRSVALSEDQQDQLIQVITQERDRFPWTTDLNRESMEPGLAGGNPSAMFSEDQLNRAAQEREQFDNLLLARSQQFLTPEQTEALRKSQATQREILSNMTKMFSNMTKLGAKMFAPKDQ